MRDILKRIFIGVAIGMALFFLKTEVFALSWDLVQEDEFFIFDAAKANDWTSYKTSNAYTYTGSTFDHSFTNTNGYDFMVIPLIYNITYYDSGSTSGTNYSIYGLTDVVIRVVLVSDGNWSTCELQNNFAVCPILKDLTYSAIRFYYVAPIQVDAYSVRLRINNAVSLQNFTFASAIQQQTDDIQNSDAPADATYNNDYSTTAYDTAESNMNQNINTDVSSFIFNPSQWINAFNWIWQTLTSFVQVNGKVFATITSFLTFSFVGLVIGRS